MVKSAKQKSIAGDEAFKLYDTYGFPMELTADIAQEQGLDVDRAGFEKAMDAQRERSRAASQFGQGIFVPGAMKLPGSVKPEFVGYDRLEADGHELGIWKNNQWNDAAREGDEIGLILDRSPFYGEAGGQIGDTGTVEVSTGVLQVVDTKWVDDLLVHLVKVTQGEVRVNDPARGKVDPSRRQKVSSTHTATHLLHWALRSVLGPQTTQAGSLVEVERMRFDFASLGGLHEEQRYQVEQLVNEKVRAADHIHTDQKSIDEARKEGALALFGEKYGHHVRVVNIGSYSKELCGGTHLGHTGAIGTLKIVSESSIAAGTRRIEAVVGESALTQQQQESRWLGQVASRLSRPPQQALEGLEELVAQLGQAEKQVKALKLEVAQARSKELIADAKRIDGTLLVSARIDGADRELLAAMADAIRSGLSGGIVLLVSGQPGAVSWVMGLTADLVKRGLHAGKLLKPIAAITDGGGGGRPEFAQAGGKDPAKIPEALAQAEALMREALAK